MLFVRVPLHLKYSIKLPHKIWCFYVCFQTNWFAYNCEIKGATIIPCSALYICSRPRCKQRSSRMECAWFRGPRRQVACAATQYTNNTIKRITKKKELQSHIDRSRAPCRRLHLYICIFSCNGGNSISIIISDVNPMYARAASRSPPPEIKMHIVLTR